VELHPQAQQQAEDYVNDFADSLLLQSKALALAQKANVVLSTHVDSARQIILSREQSRGRWREILIIVGSALIGTFLQGFPNEMATDPVRKRMIIFNVCMGVLGALLLAWGLAKKT
jgi:hypothetical protein